MDTEISERSAEGNSKCPLGKRAVATSTGILALGWSLTKLNSVVLVRKRTIPTERPQPVGEVSAKFS
jgi:hypothetical protein